MKTSKIEGVYYAASHSVWFARSRHKRTLYRGLDQLAAEAARLDYNTTRTSKGHAEARTLKGRFGGVTQPTWPISSKFEKGR